MMFATFADSIIVVLSVLALFYVVLGDIPEASHG